MPNHFFSEVLSWPVMVFLSTNFNIFFQTRSALTKAGRWEDIDDDDHDVDEGNDLTNIIINVIHYHDVVMEDEIWTSGVGVWQLRLRAEQKWHLRGENGWSLYFGKRFTAAAWSLQTDDEKYETRSINFLETGLNLPI